MVWAKTVSSENSRTAISLAHAPILDRRMGSCTRVFMAWAKASGSWGGTRNPFCPVRTISRQPGASVATIARPQDAASIKTLGTPSPYEEGRQTTLAWARTFAISSWYPHHSTRPDLVHATNCASGIEPGFSG